MGTQDYALLIGISGYPKLGADGTAMNLNGPANDVKAVRAWLEDRDGGDVPGGQIFEVLSPVDAAGRPTGAEHPSGEELEKEITNFRAIALFNKSQKRGFTVGRRLYIYMSGHGFSPKPQQACLYAANANEWDGYNVHATGWLGWLQDSGFFQEYVLWMDCCMDRMFGFQAKDLATKPISDVEPPRACFVALAAPRALRAVEVLIPDDGKVHGVFTWALLEGLRGAAADKNGVVTGRSLADWVRNAQIARMGASDLRNIEVSKEPEILREDPGLIFARGVEKHTYPVAIAFPAAAIGQKARLWSGSPPTAKEFAVANEPVLLPLQPGLYLVDVPGAGLRQGFEVLGKMDLMVESTGPEVPPTPPGKMFDLQLSAANNATIYVIDSSFSLADGGPTPLSTRLPFGLFKVKTKLPRAPSVQWVIMLDGTDAAAGAEAAPPVQVGASRSPTPGHLEPSQRAVQPAIVTAPDPIAVPPVLGTSTSHEYHWGARVEAIKAANALTLADDEGALVVMARTFSGREGPERGANTQPWRGISVVDALGTTVLDLESDSARGDTACDPWAFSVKPVRAGGYFLRHRLDTGRILEQSLIVCKGFRHEVHVLRRVLPEETKLAERPRVSVMMRRQGQDVAAQEEDRVIETARLALADERRILNTELERLLLQEFENPIAGMIGAHLLLVERDRDPFRDISPLTTAVRRLQSMVGSTHPDVSALALQCLEPKLRRVGALIGPPMFQRSWTLLSEAAQKRPNLIPAEMYERVLAMSALPPLLVWAADDAIKAGVRRQLVKQLTQEDRAPEQLGAPRDMVLANARVDVEAVRAMLPAGAASNRGKASRSAARMQKQRLAQMQLPPSALDVLRGKPD